MLPFKPDFHNGTKELKIDGENEKIEKNERNVKRVRMHVVKGSSCCRAV